MNILTVSGTVISADFKDASEMSNSTNDLLRLKMNVRSGQKKREGDEYPPSYVLSVPIWGKFATAIKDKVSKGSKICISGTLAAPTIYGESGINMELHNVNLDSFQLFDSSERTEEAEPGAKSTKKEKKAKADNLLSDTDTADDDDIPF
jgi:single-stranded DNA-binding protein